MNSEPAARDDAWLEVGSIEALYRYPVKSMAAQPMAAATIGWHGLEGDRRFAFRRLEDRSGFPWLSASRLADMLLFTPFFPSDATQESLPAGVRLPDGTELPLFSDALNEEVSRRLGSAVSLMQLKQGIFDDASISLLAIETVEEIGRVAGSDLDVRRFRPNIVVRLRNPSPFQEDGWVGGSLSFGDGPGAPAVSVTMHDVRCSMVNLDPDTAASTPSILKSVVRLNGNNAGVYGTVIRTGRLAVGQRIYYRAASGA